MRGNRRWAVSGLAMVVAFGGINESSWGFHVLQDGDLLDRSARRAAGVAEAKGKYEARVAEQERIRKEIEKNPEKLRDVIGAGGGVGGGPSYGSFGPYSNRLVGLRYFASRAPSKPALDWLETQQGEDGLWRPKSDKRSARRDSTELGDVGTTAITCLAFLASGHGLYYNTRRDPLHKAIQALVRRQDDAGVCCDEQDSAARSLEQALVALTMVEALVTSEGQPLLRRPATKSVEWLLANQREDGAWAAQVGDKKADLLSTVFALEALVAAEAAGLSDVREATAKAMDWIQNDRANRVKRRAKDPVAPAKLWAHGVFGYEFTESEVKDLSSAAFATMEADGLSKDLWQASFVGLVTRQLSGNLWKSYMDWSRSGLATQQKKDGSFPASLDPSGRHNGDVVATALAVICTHSLHRYQKFEDWR